ncbi:MAG: hypothetical protein ABIE84_02015 [bacterium]
MEQNVARINNFQPEPYIRSTEYERNTQTEQEFLAIFYKELLKQTFKTPDFGIGEEGNTPAKNLASEILIDKLSLELARKGSFTPDQILHRKVTQ